MKKKIKTILYNKVFCKVLDKFLNKDLNDSIILNESDMKSLLYCRLFDKKIFSEPIKYSRKYPSYKVNLLHTEYYRTKNRKSKKGPRGRWDIAVLYPDAYPESWIKVSDKDADYHNRRPIMIGCELKYKYYRNPGKNWKLTTIKEIDGDASVFSGKHPKYGWVVYIDVRKDSKGMMTIMQQRDVYKKLKAMKRKLPHVCFRYVEYDEERGRRRIIKV